MAQKVPKDGISERAKLSDKMDVRVGDIDADLVEALLDSFNRVAFP